MAPGAARRERKADAAGYESWAAWTEAVAGEAGHPVCGEPTVKQPVRPCSRPEAWGVEGAETGPCAAHQDDAGAKRQAVKDQYLRLVAGGRHSLEQCARRAGVDRKTLDRWCETDPDFASARRDAETARARRRVEDLGDSMYRAALAGETTGSERIFLLKVYAASLRRRGEEPFFDWDQPDRLEVTGSIQADSPREELEKELDRIAGRMADGQRPPPESAER